MLLSYTQDATEVAPMARTSACKESAISNNQNTESVDADVSKGQRIRSPPQAKGMQPLTGRLFKLLAAIRAPVSTKCGMLCGGNSNDHNESNSQKLGEPTIE